MISPDYSTTRLLVTDKPECFDKQMNDTVTLLKSPDSDNKISEGGLRLQGYFKTSTASKPLITVVTVVYNGAEFLEETIKSVIEQTYDNVEYIIVDGGSTDGTLDIIRKYEHAIDYWVSEPDKGIYDAMNKGIDLGSGDWINFMNAGDLFFECETLTKVFSNGSDYSDANVIYGDHEVRYPNKTKIVKAGKVCNLWKGSQFCHQSAFIRLMYHKANQFNLCREIAADFEFFYKASSVGLCMRYYPIVLSKVSSGGVSDSRRLASIVERYSCLDRQFIRLPHYVFFFFSELIKLVVKRYVKIKPR